MTRYIAIVGCGPKGTYAFERLAAQLNAHPLGEPIEIHLFNRTPHFGAGEIYQPDQPPYLLINFASGNVNMWIDEEPPAVVPNTPSLVEWQQQYDPQADPLGYATRAEVGRYLSDGLDDICSYLPFGVCCRYFVGEVVDLWEEEGDYRLTLKSAEETAVLPHRYAHVLLATGHPRNPPDPCYSQTAQASDLHYVPFIYPVSETLAQLPARQAVAIKGMGLTFVDAVLALTEGRGGRFVQTKQQLAYRASGREPRVIYPFSRTGVPTLPRPPHLGEAKRPLRHFTPDAVEQLLAKGERVDFEETVWPLLAQEMQAAFEEADGTRRTVPFDACHFLDPLADANALPPAAQHRFVTCYWQTAVYAAQVTNHPLAAVTAVWRQVSPLFRQLYQFGGLTPQGQQTFEQRYAGALNRVTYGPPLASVQKLLALVQAGLLRFDYSRDARVEVEKRTGSFLLVRGKNAVPVRQLIDARIPKVSVDHNRSPLYKNLLKNGLARPFINAQNGRHHCPGCLDFDESGALLNADGQPTRIHLTGTPTEGVLFDNDSLSRHNNNLVSGWAKCVATELTHQTIQRIPV